MSDTVGPKDSSAPIASEGGLAVPPLQPPLGWQASRGFAWMAAVTVAGKVLSVVGQVALAWLLTKADFGLVALAYSLTALPSIIGEFGLRESLVRRGERFSRWSNAAVWMSICAAAVAALAVAASAPVSARMYRNAAVAGPILFVAAGVALNLLSTVPLAKLQIQLRFRLIAAVSLATSFANTVLMVVLAVVFVRILHWPWAGVYAFVVPLPVVALGRLVVLWWMTRPPVRLRLQIHRWPHLFGDSARILGGKVFGMFILVGGSIMLGLYHADEVVGVFYFALNQSTQSLALFAVNLDSILFPTLARLAGEPARMRQAYLQASGVLALVGVPACLLQGVLADPGIRAVFDPQWVVSIPALTILGFGMTFRLVGFSAPSMVQAQGRLWTYLVMLAIGGVSFGVLVWGAARWSDPSHAARNVAWAIAAYFAVEGPVFTYVVLRPLGGTWREVGRLFAIPMGVGLVAAAVGWGVTASLPSATRSDNALRLLAGAAAMLATYVPLARRFDRSSWDVLRQRLSALRRRDRSR